MAMAEDIFEARLKRIHGNPKATRASSKSNSLKQPKQPRQTRQRSQTSMLLPIAATAFLVIGATAFAAILFLPEAPGNEFYASDGLSSFATEGPLE